jgi:hypothetical protein
MFSLDGSLSMVLVINDATTGSSRENPYYECPEILAYEMLSASFV